MAMTVIKFCPKCGANMGGGVDSRGIGKPFKICGRCGAYVIDKDNNEWELKDTFEKLEYLFVLCWSAVLFGIAFPFGYSLISEYSGNEFTDKTLFTAWVVGVVVMALWLFYVNRAEIIDSRERMRDPEYRKILVQLNLLRE